jgi:hypothetical protein
VYGTTEESYRKATTLVNRVRYQEDATPSRTLRDNTEHEGERIMQQHGFTSEGLPIENTADYTRREATLLKWQEVGTDE